MADNNAHSIDISKDDIPEDSRLAKYCQEYGKILRQNSSSSADFFMKVYNECYDFLEKKFQLRFPKIHLEFGDQKDYDQWRKCYELLKKEKPDEYAFCDCTSYPEYCAIYINLEKHLRMKMTESFIATLSSSYLEELFHCDDPCKKHGEFAEKLCSAIEVFLEISLPTESKQKLLRRLSER